MTQQGWIIRNAFIVLVAERPINTDMLNPEILRESGITPAQWELVEPTEGRAGNVHCLPQRHYHLGTEYPVRVPAELQRRNCR